jgi:hypothetical protein
MVVSTVCPSPVRSLCTRQAGNFRLFFLVMTHLPKNGVNLRHREGPVMPNTGHAIDAR